MPLYEVSKMQMPTMACRVIEIKTTMKGTLLVLLEGGKALPCILISGGSEIDIILTNG
jgi:hypothetical protein